jgi:hypothetical protein
LSSGLHILSTLCRYLHRDSPYTALYLVFVRGVCSGVVDTVKSWATAQSGDVYQQLTGGIRFLDLRMVHDPQTNSWRTDHMLMGDTADKIADDIARFMKQFTSEILVVQVSHYAGVVDKSQLDDLADIFIGKLDGMLLERRNDLQITIGEMVKSNKRILLTGSRHRMYSHNPYFWNEDSVFEGFYANTDVLEVMEKHNHKQLKRFGGSGRLFQMYFTLTLQGIKDIELGLMSPARNPHSLRSLAMVANKDFGRWVADQSQKLRMSNILMTDFFETTTLLEFVKKLNVAMSQCDDDLQLRSMVGCRSLASNCSATVQQQCKLSCGVCSTISTTAEAKVILNKDLALQVETRSLGHREEDTTEIEV